MPSKTLFVIAQPKTKATKTRVKIPPEAMLNISTNAKQRITPTRENPNHKDDLTIEDFG